MFIFRFLPDWLDSVLKTLDIQVADLISKAAHLAIIWFGAWLTFRAVGILAHRIERAADDGDDRVLTMREKRGFTLAQVLKSIGRVIVLAIAVMLSLGVFINIGPLLAGAGVLGLAVSFGAQSLVKDFFAGFFVLFEDLFTVGDIVELNGKAGVVEKMTLRMVQVRGVDGTLHTIPNGTIDVVSNQTRGWARAIIEVGIGYGQEVDAALDVFRDEAATFSDDPEWTPHLDGPLEVWGVESLGDSAVVIRVVARTQPGQQFAVGREFNRRIKNRLDAEGIEIPFPQRTMHLRVDDDRAARALARGAAGG